MPDTLRSDVETAINGVYADACSVLQRLYVLERNARAISATLTDDDWQSHPIAVEYRSLMIAWWSLPSRQAMQALYHVDPITGTTLPITDPKIGASEPVLAFDYGKPFRNRRMTKASDAIDRVLCATSRCGSYVVGKSDRDHHCSRVRARHGERKRYLAELKGLSA